MEWSQIDTWENVLIRFGKGNSKALKEIATAQNTHELVYSYLRADKSASGLDEKLLTILAGVLQVKDLSDSFNACLMISMARILVALGVMKPGNIVDVDFFKVIATWQIHTLTITDFVGRTAKGLDES